MSWTTKVINYLFDWYINSEKLHYFRTQKQTDPYMAIIKSVRGFTPEIGEDCFLADNAAIIGDVVIGEGCSIWFGTEGSDKKFYFQPLHLFNKWRNHTFQDKYNS